MLLRLPREDDVPAITDACQDPAIRRWTRVPSPYTREDASAWVALARIARDRGSALHLAIARVEDDALIGSVGADLRRSSRLDAELGYWVAERARGHGYAARAVRLLTPWVRETLGLERLEIHVMTGNDPSGAVARSSGFELSETRRIEFKGRLERFEVYVPSVLHS